MSKLVKRALGVLVGTDPSVVALVLYFGTAKNTDGSDRVFTQSGPNADVGVVLPALPPIAELNGKSYYVVDLDSVPQVAALPEGDYDFGFAFRDAIGNESDITEAEDVSIDLTPPAAPGEVVVIAAP